MSESPIAAVEPYRRRQEITTAPATSADSLLTAIERIASNPQMDIERVRELVNLKRELDADTARRAFAAAMAEFKREPPNIIKDKKVGFDTSKGRTEYKHATLGAVCAAIIKRLSEVDISHSWQLEQAANRVKVTCVLTHAAGHSERTTLESAPDESGGKNSIQAISSAVSYLERYTLLAATGTGTNDAEDDGRGAGGTEVEYINQEQIDEIRKLGEEVGAAKEQFLSTIGVDDVSKIPVSSFRAVIALLKAKRAAKRRSAETTP